MGYLCLSRAFAYLGVPAWKIFISEAVLAMFLIAGPEFNLGAWPWVALRLPVMKRFLIVYGLFFGYGILQVIHGILAGNPLFTALRDLTFHYYPIYLFLGLWAGLLCPDLLPKLLRGFAWFNGIYGILYLLVLDRIPWFFPGVGDEIAPVSIFGQPIYSFVALLGLIAYEKELWRSWHVLGLNAFVMLGMQIRAEWLAFGVGVITLYIVTGRGKRLLQASTILAGFIGVLYVTDFSLPGPESRGGGDISVGQLTNRALAPFQADLSSSNAASGIGAETEEATIAWRTVWWFLIWDSVHSNPGTTIWGFGYGYPLGDLAPYLAGEFIRTPHNEFFYALGYTGWIGVILFFIFEGEILRLLWHVHRRTREPLGVPFWAAMMAYGMFFPVGETPYGAIPFYLITGWIAAPILLGKRLAEQRYLVPEAYFPNASASAAVVVRAL
jgi:hypothetical protein